MVEDVSPQGAAAPVHPTDRPDVGRLPAAPAPPQLPAGPESVARQGGPDSADCQDGPGFVDLPADYAVTSLPGGTRLLASSFLVSGALHVVRPQVFEPLIPPVLGPPRPWVIGSGVAELVCAAGLLTRQRWAPLAAGSLLAGVWVGNWWMAIDATRKRGMSPLTVAAWLRVPLQVPMIRAALRSPRRPG